MKPFAFRAVFASVIIATAAGGVLAAASQSPARQAILNQYANEARRADPNLHGFSAPAGRAFFMAHPGTGNPETPSCTTCHTDSPVNAGRTRASKEIGPMAVSRSPDRFTDAAKVEKWFTRNCHTVYGRACTPEEKGNYISFMDSL
jgi:hypothetical protein